MRGFGLVRECSFGLLGGLSGRQLEGVFGYLNVEGYFSTEGYCCTEEPCCTQG